MPTCRAARRSRSGSRTWRSGMRLRAYSFDRYKTKRKDDDESPSEVKVSDRRVAASPPCRRRSRRAMPSRAACGWRATSSTSRANVLFPEEFARRANALKKLGVAVEVLDVPAMKKLGMNALLGVGQGSEHESRMVVMRWNGGKKGTPPVAFIGKGVCFDTGGISIKPAGRHGGHEGRHGGRGLRGRADAGARGAQGEGQRRRRHRARREHARRQGAAPGRHRHHDVGPDHRDHQHRCRRPPRAGRRAALRQQALQAEIHGRSGDADRRDHRRARARICRPVLQRRQARRSPAQGRAGDRREAVAHAARAGIRQEDRFEIRRHEEHRRARRRLDHRGAVARAFRRQDAVGASRHRRHRLCARRRPTSTRAGARATACGCSTGWWRTTTRSRFKRCRKAFELRALLRAKSAALA